MEQGEERSVFQGSPRRGWDVDRLEIECKGRRFKVRTARRHRRETNSNVATGRGAPQGALMHKLMIVLAVTFTFCGNHWTGAEEASSKPDPVVGEWIWNGNRDVIVDPDGTAKQRGDGTAQWKLLHGNNTVERKYEFTWNKSNGNIYIDTLILSGDGKRLEGRNQANKRVWAKRVD
jgi:hypothetical protein